ncbi:MAG: hypothetical protein GQ572_00555 [Gammaproteobacteria bacterium]|jgi:hypothetical protein|nr:hypothetical protein [Gammaproteobacteria bacterium]
MSTSTPSCSLFLSPTQSNFTIGDNSQFISQLEEIGLIAKEISNQNDAFFTGKRYFDHISYMGCSPTVQFEPGEASNSFCHVKIHYYDRAKLVVSQIQARAPHCPNCSKPVKDWTSDTTEETINCKLCNTTSDIGEFNWRKMAGYARVFIEITDIFPKEAIPQQTLLDELNQICTTEWSYFYSCH